MNGHKYYRGDQFAILKKERGFDVLLHDEYARILSDGGMEYHCPAHETQPGYWVPETALFNTDKKNLEGV